MKFHNISRRDFLKIASMGIGAATLGACKAEEKAAPTATAVPPKPTEPPKPTDHKAPDPPTEPTQQGFVDAITAWLDNNPGVTLAHSEANIWDPSAIPAMVVAGTDCTILFGPCVGGGWGRQEAINAFVQGLLADITP